METIVESLMDKYMSELHPELEHQREEVERLREESAYLWRKAATLQRQVALVGRGHINYNAELEAALEDMQQILSLQSRVLEGKLESLKELSELIYARVDLLIEEISKTTPKEN